MINLLLIYYFKDLNNIKDIQNFEFFINHDFLLSKTNYHFKTFIVVNDINTFNKYRHFVSNKNIDILEYNLYGNLNIIKKVITDKFVNNLFKYIIYIDSNLIGPIVDFNDNKCWIDKIIVNDDISFKHFSGSLIMFNTSLVPAIQSVDTKYKQFIKTIPNLNIFLFRKNTIPDDYNDDIYNKYLNRYAETRFDTKYKRMFHFLKYNKLSFNYIKELVNNENEEFIHNENEEVTNKETFRLACLKRIPIIQNIEMPNISQNGFNETVLVEFRWFDHIDFLIRNTVIKLPSWSHTVVCGNQNYESVKNCCNNISENIKIIKLDINNLTPSDYSSLLTTKEFWNHFYGEKILIYQEDSYLFHTNNMDEFLEYDYIGAPWPDNQDDNSYGVGNGGFSLRSKSKMLEVIEKVKTENLELGKSTLDYMKVTNSHVLPEDVYFSKSLIDFNIGKVATRDVAIRFSQESVESINPIGGHNFFNIQNNLPMNYYQLKILNNYYKTVTHRGGWKNVINYGIDNNVIKDETKESSMKTKTFIDSCEKYFIWDKMQVIKEPWIGIIHITHNVPSYFNTQLHINILFDNLNFKNSLRFCKGLFCLSNYQKKWIQENVKYSLPNIITLYHPVSELSKYFDFNQFKTFDMFPLILLGQQLRKVTDILKVESQIISKKIWLSAIENSNSRIHYLKREINELRLDKNLLDTFINTVEMPYLKDFSEYDILVQGSILVLPLFDAAANNSVLECIISNNPIFVTRCEGTEEYLGKDYPMFFNDITEINPILESKESIFEIYEKTQNYLCNMDKSHLTYKRFYSDILKFMNDINCI